MSEIIDYKIHVQTNTESVQCLPVKYHKSNESWCLDIKTGLHSKFIL